MKNDNNEFIQTHPRSMARVLSDIEFFIKNSPRVGAFDYNIRIIQDISVLITHLQIANKLIADSEYIKAYRILNPHINPKQNRNENSKN